ncbi:MAG: hypothetical protein HYU64_01355 [Armatimonadetes bacterium]|nr:hypothetical protein [Armatimonadota bacterium]
MDTRDLIPFATLVLAGFLAITSPGGPGPNERIAQAASSRWTTSVQKKPLDSTVKKGLVWLVSHQHENGGWAQGDESPNMGGSGKLSETTDPDRTGRYSPRRIPGAPNQLSETPNVGDTCTAAMALIRAGSMPDRGPYADSVARAVDFVVGQIEASDPNSLYVTSIRGTRIQMKLGPYVDTFLTSLLLTEVKGHMPDSKREQRLRRALNKVLSKIEKNQKQNGTWDNTGWAPVLSQSLATKSLNRARQSGAKVSDEALAKAERYASGQYDRASGKFKGEGAAGVELYSSGANLGALQESVTTNKTREKDLRQIAETSKDMKARVEARKELARFRDAEEAHGAAMNSVLKRLNDDQFIRGFGSNGGEEFLSYMNISESLVVKGGREWEKWDQAMRNNLGRIQNQDGSWTGHHCITGRTFCTAAAVLVLTADRASSPLASR